MPLKFWDRLLHSIIMVMDNWYDSYTVFKNSTVNIIFNDKILKFSSEIRTKTALNRTWKQNLNNIYNNIKKSILQNPRNQYTERHARSLRGKLQNIFINCKNTNSPKWLNAISIKILVGFSLGSRNWKADSTSYMDLERAKSNQSTLKKRGFSTRYQDLKVP